MCIELDKYYVGQLITNSNTDNFFAGQFKLNQNYTTELVKFDLKENLDIEYSIKEMVEKKDDKSVVSIVGQYSEGFLLLKETLGFKKKYKDLEEGYCSFYEYNPFLISYFSKTINFIDILENNLVLEFDKVRFSFQGLSYIIKKIKTQEKISDPFFEFDIGSHIFTFNSYVYDTEQQFQKDEYGNKVRIIKEEFYVDVKKTEGKFNEEEIEDVRETLELLITFLSQRPSRSLKVVAWKGPETTDIYIKRRLYPHQIDPNKMVKPLITLNEFDSECFKKYFNGFKVLKNEQLFLTYYSVTNKFNKSGAENHILNNLQGIQQYLEYLESKIINVGEGEKKEAFNKLKKMVSEKGYEFGLSTKEKDKIKNMRNNPFIISKTFENLISDFLEIYNLNSLELEVKKIAKIRNKGAHGDNEFFELFESYSSGLVNKSFEHTDLLITLCLLDALGETTENIKKIMNNQIN